MLDIQLLRKDIDAIAARLKDRGYVLDVAGFAALEAERKAAIALECLDTIERMMKILENEARTEVSTRTDFVNVDSLSWIQQ